MHNNNQISSQAALQSRGINRMAWCFAAIVFGVLTPTILRSQPSDSLSGGTNITRPVDGILPKGTPTYKTILPVGTSIQDYGGWTRVSPPDSNPVHAYVDKLQGASISVSQQPIPKEFKDDIAGSIKTLAQSYAATSTLSVNATTLYMDTPTEGPQSVIFVKNDVLVLIKASTKLPDSAWKQYVQSLS